MTGVHDQAAFPNENEAWYLALTHQWARRLRAGQEAGVGHPPGADLDFATEVLALRPGMRVLDLAASWGRTGLELSRRGFEVTAFDLSEEMLAIGRERAAAEGLKLHFRAGTVRSLPPAEQLGGVFDAACAFYDDSLLSFADPADNRRALAGVASLLRPGGALLFGTTDCPYELPPLQHATSTTEWGEQLVETTTFDSASRTGTSLRVHRSPDGAEQVYRRVRHHHSVAEVRVLLEEAGFEYAGAWNAYDRGSPYAITERGMVIAARRTPA